MSGLYSAIVFHIVSGEYAVFKFGLLILNTG